MAAEMTYSGRVWKFGDSISTDLMMPGSVVLARRLSEEEGGPVLLLRQPPWLDRRGKARGHHCRRAKLRLRL